jgi:hypothetical protein
MHTASSPPQWGFGSEKRQMKTRQQRDFENVGPGTYKHSLNMKKKEPEFSMSARLGTTQPSFMQAPGAGTYNPSSKIF